ncbi:MAG: hypothetical protein R3E96_09720 [Planctomycetota bacterium]
MRTAQALQHADQELGLADRLSTAWDFSARSQRGGFEQAAIEDAEHRIGQAELSNWTIADRESAFTGALGLWITCGLLALFLGWKVADWRPAAKENAVTAQALPGVGKVHTPVATGSGLSVPSSEPEVEVPVDPRRIRRKAVRKRPNRPNPATTTATR